METENTKIQQVKAHVKLVLKIIIVHQGIKPHAPQDKEQIPEARFAQAVQAKYQTARNVQI